MSTGALDNLLGDLYGGQMPAQGGFGSPTMQGYGFNWYGGQPQMPEGGYYNQMAQNMAGPSYAPQGSNYYSGGAPGGGKGMIPETPSFGGKGGTPAPIASSGSPGQIASPAHQVDIATLVSPQTAPTAQAPAPHTGTINPAIGGGGAWLRALAGGQLR